MIEVLPAAQLSGLHRHPETRVAQTLLTFAFSGVRPLPLSSTVSKHMPPVDMTRQSSLPPSDPQLKRFQDNGSSLEPANPTSSVAYRDKELGSLSGFENIVNGRYSGIGRGGTVGDELVCRSIE